MPDPTREQVRETIAAYGIQLDMPTIDGITDAVMAILDGAPCPYVETSGTTSFCRLAEAPQPKVLARGRTNGLRLSSGCTFDERINVPPGTPVVVIEDTGTDRDA